MPITVTRIKGTGVGANSLLDGKVRIERWRVNANDANTDWVPTDALTNEDIPTIGTPHDTDPTLILQDISADWVPDSIRIAEIIGVYTTPQGYITTLPASYYRVSWRFGTRSDYIQQGKDPTTGTYMAIGSPCFWQGVYPNLEIIPDYTRRNPDGTFTTPRTDYDAELGTTIMMPDIWADVEMPTPWTFDPISMQQYQLKVNSEPFLIGTVMIPKGCGQYISSDATEVGPAPGQYSVTHHFRLGKNYIYDAQGEPIDTIYLDDLVWFKWTLDPLPTPQQPEQGVRRPLSYHITKIYERADLRGILPGRPGGPYETPGGSG